MMWVRTIRSVVMAGVTLTLLTSLALLGACSSKHSAATQHNTVSHAVASPAHTSASPAAKVAHQPVVVTSTQLPAPEKVSHVILVKSDNLPMSILCDTATTASLQVNSVEFINATGSSVSAITTSQNGTSVTFTEHDDYATRSEANQVGQTNVTVKVNHWGVPVNSTDKINVIVGFAYVPANNKPILQPDRLITVAPDALSQGIILPTNGFKVHGFIGLISICIPKHNG